VTFVLTGPAGTVAAEGIRTGYDDIGAAARALRDGSADLVVGALPFDLRRPAALLTPMLVRDSLAPVSGGLPTVRIAEAVPDPAEHHARIDAVLQLLRDPENPLQKVVLARALRLVADAPMDPLVILSRLAAADPEATAYLADLSPAGVDGAVLVGASPELLVARDGDQVICHPFAGSAARSADPTVDAAAGAALARSGKNQHEHRLVVDTIAEALAPLCRHLDVASQPQLTHTAALWHLRTPIHGTLRESSSTAIDLALALHPTPAVGGVPTALAVDTIGRIEGDRGFYAGAVGWCDGTGNGRWMVALRGAELSADRRSALARAGGGIIAESDAGDEVAETTAKFRTVLTGLGVL
jgi:isochorismate synthase